MISNYSVNNQTMKESDTYHGNLEVFRGPSSEDQTDFIKTYDLPNDIFDFDDMPQVAPRIEIIENEELGELFIFVLSSISNVPVDAPVEERLESHTFILTQKKLFWFMNNDSSTMDQELFDSGDEDFNSLESVIMKGGLLAYKKFTDELQKQKNTIDELNSLAIDSTSKKVLIKVANTERDMVMLQHTIDTHGTAFDKLLNNEKFITNLENDFLVYDIKWYNRQVKQLVNVYRDLLDATSALFTDIMSNNLNQLMKFLSSLSLILASSSLIAELWGMNAGGLPFENHDYGTHIMIVIAISAGVGMFIFLNKNNYFDE